MSKEIKRNSVSFRKISTISRRASVKARPVRTYQPTYQLGPRRRFDPEKVEKILKHMVDPELEEVEYSDKVVPDLCSSLSESVRDAIKELNYDRYRILVIVSISQKRQQGMHIYHSFLWDSDYDSFASHVFQNCHIFAIVTVYGIYLD